MNDLRHGAATLALAAGTEMKVIQEQLGHSSIVLTSDTYSSVLPQLALDSAEAVARLVPRKAARAGHASPLRCAPVDRDDRDLGEYPQLIRGMYGWVGSHNI